MKLVIKIFIIMILFFDFLNINQNNVNAEESWDENIIIYTTAKIPWASCRQDGDNIYKCEITPWFNSVLETLWWIIKWFTAIAAITWVLFIVINGILLSMWWMDTWAKEEVKKRISKAIIWLILLLTSWYILHIIAPWVYKI